MDNTCCKVRYLKAEISMERRTAMREYWKSKMKPEDYDDLVAAIKKEKWQ